MSTGPTESARPTTTVTPFQHVPPTRPPDNAESISSSPALAPADKRIIMRPTETPTITPSGASPTLGKLFCALAKAQANIEAATKDSKNPYYNSVYADMASIVAVSRKPLADNKLCVIQRHLTHNETGCILLDTILGHESGEWISSQLKMPVVQIKSSEGKLSSIAQAVGSATTYACRYAYAAMIRVPAGDDDGNAASGKTENPAALRRTPPTTPAASHRSAPQPEPTFVPDDYRPPPEEGPEPSPDARVPPMTNSQFAALPPRTPPARPAPAPAAPTADAPPPHPWCPLCHAPNAIYDGSKWHKGWVCGKTKGGCGAEYPIDDKDITEQDGAPPPEHVKATPRECADLSAELAKIGKDASTAFQGKWSQKLKIDSFHLLSLRQLVIMQRILEHEPAYVKAKQGAEHRKQGEEAF